MSYSKLCGAKIAVSMANLFGGIIFAFANPSSAVIDCTTTPLAVINANMTVPDDLRSENGSGPCVVVSYGGTVDFAGHRVTCVGSCGAAIKVEGTPPLTSSVTIKNAIVGGNWSFGVFAIEASQKPIIIRGNRFENIAPAGVAIFGGTRIEQNVILGTPGLEGGTAIYWSPISTSVTAASYQFIRDNYIHFQGGYGIRVRPNGYFLPGKTPPPPDIDHNFIAGPITLISEDADRISGLPARAEVYANVLVSQTGSSDPFPNAGGGDLVSRAAQPNVCDLALVATADTGDNPDLCDPPSSPFSLP